MVAPSTATGSTATGSTGTGTSSSGPITVTGPITPVPGPTTPITGTLFNYNYPYLAILFTTPIPKTTFTEGTTYTVQANHCAIFENQLNLECLNPNVLPKFADNQQLQPETLPEMTAFDNYEKYNLYDYVAPKGTLLKQYDMNQEFGAFDFGAPIPWDYDNRGTDPALILWGSVSPGTSFGIMNTAYKENVFQSMNNLEFNQSSQQWSYTSLLFNNYTITDKSEFVGLQIEECLVNTYVSVVVSQAFDHTSKHIVSHSAFSHSILSGSRDTHDSYTYEALKQKQYLNNGMNSEDASAAAEADRMNYIESTRLRGDLPSSTQITIDRNLARDSHGNLLNPSVQDFENTINATREEHISILTANRTTDSTVVSQDGKVRTINIKDDATGKVIKITTPAPKGAVTPVVREIDSLVLKSLHNSRQAIQALEHALEGKTVVKLARALGIAMESSSLLVAVGTSIGAAFGVPEIGAAVGLSLSIIMDVFIIAACSFIPAILGAYIPSDSVCPPGYANIVDTMNSMAGGSIGLLIISSIPGIGDGLSAFGPYLCSAPSGACVLKTPALAPPYFFDSTLSIFPTIKTQSTDPASQQGGTPQDKPIVSLSQDDPMYKDYRMYALMDTATNRTAPVWVDYSDFRMLDKMAQYYYNISRAYAIDNRDGTYTFEYISKIYGVAASSEFTCDIQCEIRIATFYRMTGVLQSEIISPVDPSYGTTYHDRRFYFYAIQPGTSGEASMEKAFPSITFLSNATRNSYVQNSATSSNLLDALMTDNVNRFIITGCTKTDGTAPRAQEVDVEGTYVGDALIAVGNFSTDANASQSVYYPPQITMTSQFMVDLTFAITKTISGTSPTYTITYTNQLITFSTGDIISGYSLGTNTHIDMTVAKSIISATAFTASITSIGSTANGDYTLIINVSTGTIALSTTYGIQVTTHTTTGDPATSPSQCDSMRSRAGGYSQTSQTSQQGGVNSPNPSYTLLIKSTTSAPWGDSNASITSGVNKNSRKIWIETKGDPMQSESNIAGTIITGTTLGYIGFRINYPFVGSGAVFSGLMNVNFFDQNSDSGGFSVASLIACLYADAVTSMGTYVINGLNAMIEPGPSDGSPPVQNYIKINRGPTMPFSPGYVPNLARDQFLLTQNDCINRDAIRYAVYAYNAMTELPGSANGPEQVTKVLNIQTDPTNKQCGYIFTTTSYDPVANVRGDGDMFSTLFVIPFSLNNPLTTHILVEGISTVYSHALALTPSYETATIHQIIDGADAAETKIIPDISLNISIPSQYPTTIDIPITSLSDSRLQPLQDISRPDRELSLLGKSYTCMSPEIYTRLITQFNSLYSTTVVITGITDARSMISSPTDGTLQCVYQCNMASLNDTGDTDTFTSIFSMYLNPALSDPTSSLYDLYDNDYPDVHYTFARIPKPNQWIDIPATLFEASTILRATCTESTISTCSDMGLIENLVNQFNNNYEDAKIMKVRKAYTPAVKDKTVCDYEVEMLRNVPIDNEVVNVSTTIIQKESVRIYMKPSTTDPCLWDFVANPVGVNGPGSNTGASLTSNASIPFLDSQYYWAPNLLSNVQNTINGAILNVTNIDIKGILSNVANSINNRATLIYETILSDKSLYSPVPNCSLTCQDPQVLQAIIYQYNADMFPVSQYGAQQKKMVEIRKAGTYDSNTCQIEFINQTATYSNYIDAPIQVNNPLDPQSQYNTSYQLLDYNFTVIPSPTTCDFTVRSIRDMAKNGTLNLIDISGGNGLSLLSDKSNLVGSSNVVGLDYNVKVIPCTDLGILSQVAQQYNNLQVDPYNPTEKNSISTILMSFNPIPTVCEYNILTNKYVPSFFNPGTFDLVSGYQETLVATWQTNVWNPMSYPTVDEWNFENTSFVGGEALRNGDPIALPYIFDFDPTINTGSNVNPEIAGNRVNMSSFTFTGTAPTYSGQYWTPP
jgi:hypothetical protein